MKTVLMSSGTVLKRSIVSVQGLLQKGNAVNLEFVMSFQFDPLVHRMVDKHGWTEANAKQCFEDLKRYLWLCASTGKPLVPSKKIDQMWHDFILFTMDYSEFCEVRLGRFIHHRPRRRDDEVGQGGTPVGVTLKLAKQAFGTLSKYWEYEGVVATASCSCSNYCQCS